MKGKILTGLLLTGFMPMIVLAQTTSQKVSMSFALSGSLIVKNIHEDWNQKLLNLDMPEPDGNSEYQKLQDMKDSLQDIFNHKTPNHAIMPPGQRSLDTINVWKNFQSNLYNNGTPNDNELAVSNGGFVISVMNSTIYFYNLNTDTSAGYTSLQAFSAVLNNTQGKYDPKVIYDPIEDKFIVVYLAGYLDSTSNIIVAFSQTNDPTAAWNFYELSGNPLSDTLWSDYPQVSLTQGELFITINHIHNNQPWQTAFVRTAIWQVNKFNGYSGSTLNTLLHYNIQYNGKFVRNVCPVKGGSALYGPDAYFLSERNFAVQNDTVFLIHLSDTMNAPGQTLSVSPLIADNSYFVPVDAIQPGPGVQQLATNDSRVLGAFYENNKIQFVGNTTDMASGHAAFYHGIISNVSSSPTVHLQIIADDSLHFGYPNIAYIGNATAGDNRAIISFLHSSKTVFPGSSAMYYNGNGYYSPYKMYKQGLNYFSILSGEERWGDYSGTQRDYTDSLKVWVNGSFGTTNKKHNTWIAELSIKPYPLASVTSPASYQQPVVFPNPSADVFNIKFFMLHETLCRFELYDLKGMLIKTLLNDRVMEGENIFSFSAQPLSAGEYLLLIRSGDNKIFSQKVLKQ